MYKKTVAIDLNAHIDSLEYRVINNGNAYYGELSFFNLSYGTIHAIKFHGEYFNSFGDILPITNTDLLLQDLNIPPCSYFKYSFSLPDFQIRNFKLSVISIIFENGIVEAVSPNPYSYDIDVLDENDPADNKLLVLFRKAFPYSICLPKTNEIGWICTCGRWNSKEQNTCSRCGSKFEEVGTTESIKGIVETKLSEQKQKKNKKRALFFSIVGVIILALVVGIYLGPYRYFKLGYSYSELQSGNLEAARKGFEELGNYKTSRQWLDIIDVVEDYQGTWYSDEEGSSLQVVIKGRTLYAIVAFFENDVSVYAFDIVGGDENSLQLIADTVPIDGDTLIWNGRRYHKVSESVKVPEGTEAPSIGMTKEEALASTWGAPESINTTETSGNVHEQWVYPNNRYLYFDNGVLTGIQE
ncbi:MAG TPA: DUF2845 domain-containing protein [Firmicutes bacterium]|nr:DUF2845 domain-containing protein [Bacillota bacterium]